MATIQHSGKAITGSTLETVWTPLASATSDVGTGEGGDRYPEKTMVANAFTGGGTVKLEKSDDGSSWSDLDDATGNVIAVAASATISFRQVQKFIRPAVVGTVVGATITVTQTNRVDQ